ncbi:MAG: DMT family transporter [Bacteroidota bacterium]|nr:DMT family transporter [Bacteroidota bacterium]MDX5506547.1 DMT family transporter [Bacteroidota bacterium]
MSSSNRILGWAIFISLAIIWGSSFILMKRGLDAFDPYQIAAIRIGSAALFTLGIGFRRLKNLRRKDIWPLFLVGLMGNAIPYLLFPIAVTRIDTSVVGIINSLVPIFTLIIGLLWFKNPIKPSQFLGVTVGFIGAYFLINPDTATLERTGGFALFAVAATICYAISVNLIQDRLRHLDSLTITVLSLLSVGIPYLIYLFLTDFTVVLTTHPKALASLGYVILLGVLGTGIAVIFFNYLIKMTSAIFASSVTYLIPVMAIFWGWLDGEPIGLRHAVGVMGILLGVYLVNLKKKPRQPKDDGA